MANYLTIRDARIIYRNFAGIAKDYNPAGRRNFSVVIDDPQLADQLINDGWNVKPLRKRDEDEEQHWHLPVAVNYGPYPPQITMIAGNVRTLLDESSVGRLDRVDVAKVDLTIRPREYEMSDRSGVKKGIKAYLKTMYVTIEEDELDADYADIPFAGQREEDSPF